MRYQNRLFALSFCGVLMAIGCGGEKAQGAAAAKADAPSGQPEMATPDVTQSEGGARGSSTIRGTVTWSGSAPAQARIKMDADPQCLLQHTEPVSKQEVVVNPDGTLKHVFVYVKQGLEGQSFPSPTQAVNLDQHGCLYTPRVFGIQVNQPLEITNSDPTLHNVNCKATKSQPFNIAQPTKGMKTTKKFAQPEIMVKCACNVHPWMAAYIGVVSHPYFSVSGDDGAFALTGLPAGQYTIEAWHEKGGTQTQTVSVGEGQTKEVGFEFKAQ
jgi:hypothetical protein